MSPDRFVPGSRREREHVEPAEFKPSDSLDRSVLCWTRIASYPPMTAVRKVERFLRLGLSPTDVDPAVKEGV
jgi:hypothetical protein